jgi:hypothetical protein
LIIDDLVTLAVLRMCLRAVRRLGRKVFVVLRYALIVCVTAWIVHHWPQVLPAWLQKGKAPPSIDTKRR